MKLKMKKLRDQVMVITGCTSGIGLATARRAAKQGAKLVLAARSEQALRQMEQELRVHGEAVCVTADVGHERDVRKIADTALHRFGGFDTWVNNAGVGIYGKILDVPIEEQRKVFETNYWGLVYGSRVAADHLRRRGGALINIGSVASDRAIPLLGTYAASKAAVKSFTDALRMELEEEGAPVSVTLIQPASIDTPFPQHAGNFMEAQPRLAPPVYTPDTVADAILDAAQRPIRNLYIGGAAKIISSMEKLSPRLTDWYMEQTMFDQQKAKVAKGRKSILNQPSEDLRERGEHDGRVLHSSAYTRAARSPVATTALAVGVGLGVAALLSKRSA